MSVERQKQIASLFDALAQRILVLDGAMGTMIQSFGLNEDQYRGERFADWAIDLRGNNDLLSLTRRKSSRIFIASFLPPAQTYSKPIHLIQTRLPWAITAWSHWCRN